MDPGLIQLECERTGGYSFKFAIVKAIRKHVGNPQKQPRRFAAQEDKSHSQSRLDVIVPAQSSTPYLSSLPWHQPAFNLTSTLSKAEDVYRLLVVAAILTFVGTDSAFFIPSRAELAHSHSEMNTRAGVFLRLDVQFERSST